MRTEFQSSVHTSAVNGVVRTLEMFVQSLTAHTGVPEAKYITVGWVGVREVIVRKSGEKTKRIRERKSMVTE